MLVSRSTLGAAKRVIRKAIRDLLAFVHCPLSRRFAWSAHSVFREPMGLHKVVIPAVGLAEVGDVVVLAHGVENASCLVTPVACEKRCFWRSGMIIECSDWRSVSEACSVNTG